MVTITRCIRKKRKKKSLTQETITDRQVFCSLQCLISRLEQLGDLDRAKGATPVQVEAVKEVKQEEVKTERGKAASSGKTTASTKTIPAKTASSRRSREGDRARSRDRQTERERQRRGERSRGGDSKGSGYKPRTRPECRVYISNIPFDLRWQEVKDLFRSEG